MDLDSDDESIIEEDYYTFLNVTKEVKQQNFNQNIAFNVM